MDAPSYQRAVTPSAEAVRTTPVRGKMLAYNRKQSGSGESSTVASTSTRVSGAPSGGTRKASTYVLAPPSSLDMNVQGRTASGLTTSGVTRLQNSSKQGGSQDQTQNYFMTSAKGNSDLEPLTDEIPSDGVVFARSRNAPSHLVVFRTQEEKTRNPERLNLDRRQLDVCPLLKNEQRLRLLNYQNNNIRVISNLENLPNLIFLDLYNNKLNTLEGPLSTLRGLRVLMIGKNRISTISNLSYLKKLDVLDLHSNDIGEINGLDGLADLRVLNLAGNRIQTVANLTTLVSLTELNLRRNSIERIFDLDAIPVLQRIFLSHNLIKSISDIKCILSLKNLIELSLDGNPLSSGSNQAKYRFAIISELPGLKHLDLQKITEEERRPPVIEASSAPAEGKDELALLGTVSGNGQQLFHLSKFLGTVASIGGLPPSGAAFPSMPGSRVGTSHGRNRENVEKPISGSDSEVQNAQSTLSASNRHKSIDSMNSGNGTAEKVCVDQTNLGTIGLLKMSSSGLNAASPIAQLANKTASAKPAERLFDMNTLEIFDLPGAGNSKCLQATGEQWDWNHTRRSLSLVTAINLDRISSSAIGTKFISHANLMPGLKKLTLNDNNISSLNDIVALSNLFPSVEHLTFTNQPIDELSPALLQGAIITCFPKLKSYNQLPISVEEREKSSSMYSAIIRADVASSTLSATIAPFDVTNTNVVGEIVFPKAVSEATNTDCICENETGDATEVSSPKQSSLVSAASSTVTDGVGVAAPYRQMQKVAGYNVASLGGNMSCVFSTSASSSASKLQKDLRQTAFRARELERKGFDEAFSAALANIMTESTEDLRTHWSRYTSH